MEYESSARIRLKFKSIYDTPSCDDNSNTNNSGDINEINIIFIIKVVEALL